MKFWWTKTTKDIACRQLVFPWIIREWYLEAVAISKPIFVKMVTLAECVGLLWIHQSWPRALKKYDNFYFLVSCREDFSYQRHYRRSQRQFYQGGGTPSRGSFNKFRRSHHAPSSGWSGRSSARPGLIPDQRQSGIKERGRFISAKKFLGICVHRVCVVTETAKGGRGRMYNQVEGFVQYQWIRRDYLLLPTPPLFV